MINAIKAQCFKGKTPDQVSDAQLAACFRGQCAQAESASSGMMYPYPDRNGSVL